MKICLKILIGLIAIALLAIGCRDEKEAQMSTTENLEKAAFAAGCFWHAELVFQNIKGVKKTPIKVKITPPTNSLFQAKIRKISKMNEGVRCIIKSPICCQTVLSGWKASRANILTKRIAKMQRIRGIQCVIFMVFSEAMLRLFFEFNKCTKCCN